MRRYFSLYIIGSVAFNVYLSDQILGPYVGKTFGRTVVSLGIPGFRYLISLFIYWFSPKGFRKTASAIIVIGFPVGFIMIAALFGISHMLELEQNSNNLYENNLN